MRVVILFHILAAMLMWLEAINVRSGDKITFEKATTILHFEVHVEDTIQEISSLTISIPSEPEFRDIRNRLIKLSSKLRHLIPHDRQKRNILGTIVSKVFDIPGPEEWTKQEHTNSLLVQSMKSLDGRINEVIKLNNIHMDSTNTLLKNVAMSINATNHLSNSIMEIDSKNSLALKKMHTLINIIAHFNDLEALMI